MILNIIKSKYSRESYLNKKTTPEIFKTTLDFSVTKKKAISFQKWPLQKLNFKNYLLIKSVLLIDLLPLLTLTTYNPLDKSETLSLIELPLIEWVETIAPIEF